MFVTSCPEGVDTEARFCRIEIATYRHCPAFVRATQFFLCKIGSPAWRRVSGSSGNVSQPDRVFAKAIGCDETEGRPRATEEWLAAAKHERAEVDPVLVNKAKFGQTSRKLGSGDFDLPV